ncbi:MAG: gluconate:H+ symporter [Acidobacteriota bacterium]
MTSIVVAVATVVLLLLLILWARLPAFLALLACCLFAGLAGGLDPASIPGVLQEALGGVLGYIALVVGLGAMLGELLRASGAVGRIADGLLAAVGPTRAGLALGLTGLVVAVPVFFDVAFILFVPLVYALARAGTSRSHLAFALPLLAGLAVGHAFVPPTPGPVAVAGIVGADLGWVIVFGLVSGLPALLVGTVVGGRIARRLDLRAVRSGVESCGSLRAVSGDAGDHETADAVSTDGVSTDGGSTDDEEPPSLALSLALVALPLLAIVAATASRVWLPDDSGARSVLQLIGHPFTALLGAALLAHLLLGVRRGVGARALRALGERALEPIGMILLVTGAGGALGKVFVAIGVGDAVASLVASTGLPLVVFAFALAAAVRVAQGSATVSMVTAAGLVAPVVEAGGVQGPALAALVIAIAAGATVLSHVNDSGFWLVSRYLGLSERDTLRSWTVLTTVIGGSGFLVVWLLSALVG